MDSIGLAELWSVIIACFARPVPVAGMAVARVCIGLLLLVDAIPYILDRRVWLLRGGATGSVHGFWWRRVEHVNLFLALHVLGSLAFLLGASSLALRVVPFFTLRAMHHRTSVNTYGGDCLLRVAVFLLALSPSHLALSLERYATNGDLGLDVLAAPWGARLLQVEVSLLYSYNCWHKLNYRAWRDGSAVWFCLRNPDVTRRRPGLWPLPDTWLLTMAFSRLATWSTLALESALGLCLWITELRVPSLVVALGFHLLLAHFLEIWLFSHIMIATLFVFAPVHLLASAPPTIVAFGPSSDVGMIVAISLAMTYVAFAVFWSPPHSSDVVKMIRGAVENVVKLSGLSRGWKLFTGDPPASRTYSIHISITAVGGTTSAWAWSPRSGLHPAGEARGKGWGVRHRVHKLSSAFAKGPDDESFSDGDGPRKAHHRELCSAFGRYILEQCREQHIEPRLLSVYCEISCLTDPRPNAPERSSFRRNIYSYVSPHSTEEERMSMVLSLRTNPALPVSIDLLVYLGVRARAAGRDDHETLTQLRERLRTSSPDPKRLHALCAWARELAPEHSGVYVDLLASRAQDARVDPA